MKEFEAEIKELKKKNLLRKFSCIESSLGSKISINGQTFVNFSSNDYLNLSNHPKILKAAITALKKYGLGSGSSRLLSGTFKPHVKLEEKIARYKKTQAALVFNTGYAANTGIIPVIAGPDAVVFSDELNHASIVDGLRLSKAKVKIYKHKDVNHLAHLLKSSSKIKTVRRRLIITDTVFSMDGDIAPLPDILHLCKKYNALLMIDDAHGTGVLGKTGRGGLEHFGIENTDSIIQMGTLSKAAGCFGAFIAGSVDLIDLLISRARSFVYSTSLPPAIAEACTKAIDIVESGSGERRKRLWRNRKRLYNGLQSLGYDTLNSETPIIPVLTGDVNRALKISEHLYRERIFVPAIRPPTVPEGKCRIRFSVTAAHTSEDIDRVLESLKKV
jgi:8-amino-7-oxononanoate synthase